MRRTGLRLCCSSSAAQTKRAPDPIPPVAQPISLEASLARVPMDLRQRLGVQLVLDRTHRQLLVLRDGVIRRRYPAAVGTEGWETPAGRHRVLQKVREPVWTHPVDGRHISGEKNPLGTRWIGFYRDCEGRNGWDGEQYLDIEGCTVAGFHGTPSCTDCRGFWCCFPSLMRRVSWVSPVPGGMSTTR